MPLSAEAVFFRSVHDLKEFPPDVGAEIAFAGRSNAGKSTAINALVGRRRLARVSKSPGRTQSINFFHLGSMRYLVDLPGYGYAAVPASEKRHWEKLISTYLQTRASLRGLVLVIDARRLFTDLDHQLLHWLAPLHRPVLVLLTKSDILTKPAAAAALQTARKVADGYPLCTTQLFSGTAGIGVRVAQQTLSRWWT